MATKKRTPKRTVRSSQSHNPLGILETDYSRWQNLYEQQPAEVRQFLEVQAQTLANTLTLSARQAWFFLPQFVASEKDGQLLSISESKREHKLGNRLDRLFRRPAILLLRNRLDELEAGTDEAVALSAGLTRYATGIQLVHHTLPSGQTVTYRPLAGEEIPTIPNGAATRRKKPYAQRFFMPEWVALDAEDSLLVPTSKEAERIIAQMEHYFSVLHMSVRLAPYMVADPEYQRRRTGILGQLINQGRALAWFQTRAIIDLIRKRADQGALNRGLSLSLPYFDDQTLELRTLQFQIIPPGRIMFLLGFVARACRNEQAKVAQDTRLNASTRNHLLGELRLLENAFETPKE
ncbi:MAG: hypothetical protein EPO32_03880 [Anaerolineae bacterium]|nr:MAG: hypothetical protein EPO32_03880 [Anaerolineae bacterium]